MLTVDDALITQSGGVLAAIADRSAEFMQGVVAPFRKPQPSSAIVELERVIVHTEPHLDEYVAELIFRACLPPEKWRLELIEQAIFSATGDLGCKHLWPSAAVLGIGSAVSGGVQPLFLFDEHVSGQTRVAASCSQIVSDKMLTAVPDPIKRLLREVNAIDEFGGGHAQSLGNLIRSLHQVQLLLSTDESGTARLANAVPLSTEWKRAVISACIAAIVYCENAGVDLVSDPDGKRATLQASLDNYVAKSVHRNHSRFEEAVQRLRSIFGDQAKAFKEGVLRGPNGPILDARGDEIPQLLLFSRVCFACEKCWGPGIRDLVATHFWEAELQKQLDFYSVEDAIEQLFAGPTSRLDTEVGVLTRASLPDIATVESNYRGGPTVTRRRRVWVIGFVAAPGVGSTNQALQNFLNRRNGGCGVFLIQTPSMGTAALFRGTNVPDAKWQQLAKTISDKEPDCWHIIYNSTGTIAPFILNGNKAHQYVPRSALDFPTLVELIRRTFY
ncbi:MAG TPA: hypothetical protein VG944_20245 [Fimbriimonas sp.]|nr:hypothetical protein [Fimbriimonas sp.]